MSHEGAPDIPGMTPSQSGAGATGHSGPERRNNPHLRELVDEMLASIRAAANVDLWTADERARCEADMSRIMESVRAHATRKPS